MCYVISSAVGMNRRFPDTFKIPPEILRKCLVVGDFAKLVFHESSDSVEKKGERMWVIVKFRFLLPDGRIQYNGELTNDPVVIPIECGCPVKFTSDDIAGLMLAAEVGASSYPSEPCER